MRCSAQKHNSSNVLYVHRNHILPKQRAHATECVLYVFLCLSSVTVWGFNTTVSRYFLKKIPAVSQYPPLANHSRLGPDISIMLPGHWAPVPVKSA